MWLENCIAPGTKNPAAEVSILLLMDVAGKHLQYPLLIVRSLGFNPSSNGCGWKTSILAWLAPLLLTVSILLLMDVAGKQGLYISPMTRQDSFNPSSNGCGWKTRLTGAA